MFYWYSYLNQFFNLLINISPPPIRQAILKISLKKMGRSVLIDYGCYVRFPRKIIIGHRVSINRGCRFFPSYHFRDAYIIIDDDAVIAPGVTFISAGQDPRDDQLGDIAASIHVCSGAYIGANSTIRYGVTIGKNAVVAAGATVVKDVPPLTVVGGTPAKMIRTR